MLLNPVAMTEAEGIAVAGDNTTAFLFFLQQQHRVIPMLIFILFCIFAKLH